MLEEERQKIHAASEYYRRQKEAAAAMEVGAREREQMEAMTRDINMLGVVQVGGPGPGGGRKEGAGLPVAKKSRPEEEEPQWGATGRSFFTLTIV